MVYINDANFIDIKNSVVCVGNFDGLHKGHQKLIEETIILAKNENLKSLVFSFYPHPRKILNSETIKFIITSEEKRYLLTSLGLDYFIEYPFEKSFSELSPEEFFERFLLKMLNCKILVVGEGYLFGKNKSGNIEILKMLCAKHNVKLIIKSHLNLGYEKISSSNLRKWILSSEFEKAEEAMGRPYFIKEKVVMGKQIGRKLNFPTANIIADEEKLLPNDGIYATRTLYSGKLYKSVTNIGENPTLNGDKRTIETYIFDFDENIYDKEIVVYFYRKLRDEMKFINIEQLKKQILNDVLNAQKYFDEQKFYI